MEAIKEYQVDKYYSGLDGVKLLAAVFVLMSHTGLLSSYIGTHEYYVINGLFRWCVPFFFMCSGFFLPKNTKKYLHYIGRILLLYSFWTILSCIIIPLPQPFTMSTIKNFLFNGLIIPFWYFPSLIFTVSFVYFLSRHFKAFNIFLVCLFLYFIGLMGDSYANLPVALIVNKFVMPIHSMFFSYTTRDGLLFGSVFVSIGYYLSTLKEQVHENWSKDKQYKLFWGILIFFMLEIAELYILRVYSLGSDRNLLITAIPLTTAIFICALGKRIKVKKSLWLRKMSVLIYVLHYAILSHVTVTNSLLRFFIVLGLTFIVSSVLVFLGDKIKFLNVLL